MNTLPENSPELLEFANTFAKLALSEGQVVYVFLYQSDTTKEIYEGIIKNNYDDGISKYHDIYLWPHGKFTSDYQPIYLSNELNEIFDRAGWFFMKKINIEHL